jgi:hypothetical protein
VVASKPRQGRVQIARNGVELSPVFLDEVDRGIRVSVEVAGFAPGLKDGGENTHTAAGGACGHEKETESFSEATGVTVTLNESRVPAMADAVSLKSTLFQTVMLVLASERSPPLSTTLARIV